jgi:DNA polymerase-3 subunit gamma/tau
MLLSQQATLVRLDGQRAVVRVAGNWMAMVQGRLPLLERAMQAALGGPRQVILEGAEGHQSTATPAKAVPPPAPKPQSEPHSPGQIATPIAVALTAAVAVVTPAPAPMSAGIATAAPPSAAPTPVELPAQRALPGSIDEKAKRLADFFNGEVISDFSDDMA